MNRKNIGTHFGASLLTGLILIFGFNFHQQPRHLTVPASVAKMPAPQGAVPAADSFVADFDSTTALGKSLERRDIKVFEAIVDEARKNPVQEYQLALDLLEGRNVRLYQQQAQVANHGSYNPDCHCFVAPASPALQTWPVNK